MPIDSVVLINSAVDKSNSMHDLLEIIMPTLSALIVGILAYIGIIKTSKSQINSSLSIAKYQLFGDLILNSKNKWKDDLMDSIANLLTEVDPDVRPIENGRFLINMDKIVHLIFRIQLMLNPDKFISHKNLNENLSALGNSMAGYHGGFRKEELLQMQNSIFVSAKTVGKEVWDEIQSMTKPS